MSSEAVAKHRSVRSDSELLSAFRRQGDQGALAELIARHHRLVLGVCQQLLGNSHDADDAYQATFLVLLRKSHQIRRSSAMASWLYGVAFRVASRIRQRRARMKPLDFDQPGVIRDDPLAAVMLRDQQAALHAAIVRLPEKLRQPVIFRYLLGQANADVAEQLAISEAAVEGRLRRAKVRLRRQLTRQGMTMAAALATLPLAGHTVEASERLISLAVQRCALARVVGGSGGAGGGGRDGVEAGGGAGSSHARPNDMGWPGPLHQLVTEEIRSMLSRQLTQIVLVVGVGAAAAGLAIVPRITQAQPDGETITIAPQDQPADPFGSVTVQLARGSLAKVTRADLSIGEASATEKLMVEKLDQPATIEFFDAPLHEVVAVLEDQHGLQIEFDQPALDEMGISPEATINKQVKDISLRSALNLMLRELGLTYIIRDEVLTITTPEAAQEHVYLRLYPYRSEWRIKLEQLAEAIQVGIAPDTWDDVGGHGTVYEYDGGLIVSHTAEVHERIVDLLMMLTQQAQRESPKP